MDMTYEDALVMPNNCAMMDEEEMTYVEGGGTLYVTFTKSTICNAIGVLGGVVTKAAVTALLESAAIGVATAIELGTAGTGTLVAGLVLVYGSTVAAAAAAKIVKNIASGVYTGGDITLKVASGSLVPSFTLTI